MTRCTKFQLRVVVLGPLVLFTLLLVGCGGSSGQGGSPGNPNNPNNAELKGTYVFSVTGALGRLQADGNGNITGGVEDLADPQNSLNHIFSSATGTYTIGSDGRGSITLNSSVGSQTFDLLMLSTQHGLLFPLLGPFAQTEAGTIDLQDPSAFSLASLAANSYAFLLNADTRTSTSAAAGFLSINSSGVIVSGLEDVVPLQTLALSGSIGNVDANGRATATLTTSNGTLHFALYVIDGTHLKFFGIDTGTFASGQAFSRQASFSNSSVSGNLILVMPFQLGAILNTDGAGNITGGTVDNLQFQLASGKAPALTTVTVTGSYSVASNGRGTISFADAANNFPVAFVMYPCTAGLLMLQTSTHNALGSLNSIAFQQQSASFSNASINGKLGEIEFGSSNGVEPTLFLTLGRLLSDGKGNLSGVQDRQGLGAPAPIFGASVSGNYSLAANGRGTATVGGNNYLIYAVNGSRVLFISPSFEMSSGLWAQQQ